MIRATAFMAGLLAASWAGAAERGAAVREPVRYVVDDAVGPAVWMQRLVGRFRIEGAIHYERYIEPLDPGRRGKLQEETLQFDVNGDPDPESQKILTLRPKVSDWTRSTTGKGDCINFGSGPGLQCVINVEWEDVWGNAVRAGLGGVSNLKPAMILAGLSPRTGSIRFLEVDDKGLAHPGQVVLDGNAVILKPPCVNAPGVWKCEIVVRVEARPDAGILFAQITNRLFFQRAEGGGRENVEELLTVSFSLRRTAQATDASRIPASSPPAQGSR